ncbi:hypothetical protein CYY_006806 [Polysphondylium violaceum]|uniref:U3 small nucleolar RNA-associated protein 15 C-terminal domain-containing protein n=1 Tax=Polysphondylium violaceum TaxID=133409 RepID=A0A8J4V5F8_9MYCE|nr:hypothetical protein CYY_006806 [Polysphondylium violaceum]
MFNEYTFLHNLPDIPVPYVNPVTTQDSWNVKQLESKSFDSIISRIEINPIKNEEMVVTFGNRIRFISTNSKKTETLSEIHQFKDTPYSASYREDGMLIVTGGEEPVVRVFDVQSKNCLRKFTGHTGPIHMTRFISKHQLISGSNDCSIRTWDIQTGEQIQLVGKHQDQVRCGVKHPNNENLWLTGSYDHTVKLWDTRSSSPAASSTFDHGAPVEDVVMLHGGSMAITAGGSYFKVWDLTNGKQVYKASHTMKTITSLFVSESEKRFFTGGLDQTVKIFSTQSYSLINSVTYKEPILSVAVIDNNKIISGSAKGTVYYSRKTKPTPTSKVKTTKKSKSSNNTIITEHLNIYKSSIIDKLLRKFEHRAAFDTAIYVNKSQDLVFRVVCELSRREALDIVLKGREAEPLEEILQMVNKLITNVKYQQCGIMLMEKIVDFYHTALLENKSLSNIFFVIKTNLAKELKKQSQILEIAGALDLLYQNSAKTPKRKLDEVEQDQEKQQE